MAVFILAMEIKLTGNIDKKILSNTLEQDMFYPS